MVDLTNYLIAGFCIFFGGVLLAFTIYRSVKFYYLKKAAKVHIVEPASFVVSGNLVKEREDKIIQTYEVTESLLGRGSSAEVVIGINIRTRRRYAIKIIDVSRKYIAWRYEREKKFLKDIDHTNVVRLIEVFKSKSAHFFVMELCTGGHLGQVLKQKADGRLDVPTARQYILQLLRAIAHCHQNGICHRDIKLQNILLENNGKDAQIKLIDFGNGARYRGRCPMTKIVGTTYTAAPEVFKECYDEKCDIWSIGVVAYILLSGRRPFESLDIPNQPKSRESSLIASILMGRYHFMHEVWEDVGNSAIHFVKTCLEMDYTARKSASLVLDHPWLAYSDLHADLGHGITRNGARALSQRMTRNLSTSGLRQTSMLAVSFNLSSQKAQQLRDLFQQIDRNGSGTVERDEFHSAMQMINPNSCPADVDLIFDSIDQDGNKHISFIEFVAATIDPREVDIQEMNHAFRLLDKDLKGYITAEDLQRVLRTSPSSMSDETMDASDGMNDKDLEFLGPKAYQEKRLQKLGVKIARIIQQADVNNDGVVSYTEFLFAMADGSADLELDVAMQSKSNLVEKSSMSMTTTVSSPKNANVVVNANTIANSERTRTRTDSGVESKSLKQNRINNVDPQQQSDIIPRLKHNRRQSESIIKLSNKKFRRNSALHKFHKEVPPVEEKPMATLAGSLKYIKKSLGDTVISILPETMLPAQYHVDRVEHRGKRAVAVSHLEDSPLNMTEKSPNNNLSISDNPEASRFWGGHGHGPFSMAHAMRRMSSPSPMGLLFTGPSHAHGKAKTPAAAADTGLGRRGSEMLASSISSSLVEGLGRDSAAAAAAGKYRIHKQLSDSELRLKSRSREVACIEVVSSEGEGEEEGNEGISNANVACPLHIHEAEDSSTVRTHVHVLQARERTGSTSSSSSSSSSSGSSSSSSSSPSVETDPINS